jgi:uncharacterized protein YuzB (UPF0349 family)
MVAGEAATAAADDDDDDDLPLSEWVRKTGCDVGHYDVYAIVDNDVVTKTQTKILSEK